jgi:hypothetical protein
MEDGAHCIYSAASISRILGVIAFTAQGYPSYTGLSVGMLLMVSIIVAMLH